MRSLLVVFRLSHQACIWYIFHILMISDASKRQERTLSWLKILFSKTDFITKEFNYILQLHSDITVPTPRATDDQIKKATALMRRIDLKDFSVCQFANPGKIIIFCIANCSLKIRWFLCIWCAILLWWLFTVYLTYLPTSEVL